MKVTRKSIIALVSFVVMGCSKTPYTDIVKGGTMQFDQSITVGQAFDSWNNCAQRTWTEFQTDNGKRVVEFSCVAKNTEEFSQELQKSEKDQHDFLRLESLTSEFQWVLNQDDSFDIVHTGFVWVWKDGKKLELDEKPEKILTQVYNDDIGFDVAVLSDPNTGEVLTGVFKEVFLDFYLAAK